MIVNCDGDRTDDDNGERRGDHDRYYIRFKKQ